jgi:predicted Rossmann-fold nucleotide-binding protein
MDIMIGLIAAAELIVQESGIIVEVRREIAKRDGTLACGGVGEAMEATCPGVKSEGRQTIGISPGFIASESNPW